MYLLTSVGSFVVVFGSCFAHGMDGTLDAFIMDGDTVRQQMNRPRLDTGFQVFYNGPTTTYFLPDQGQLYLACSGNPEMIKVWEALYIHGPPYNDNILPEDLKKLPFRNMRWTNMAVPCNTDRDVTSVFGELCDGKTYCSFRAADPGMFPATGNEDICNIKRALLITYNCTIVRNDISNPRILQSPSHGLLASIGHKF